MLTVIDNKKFKTVFDDNIHLWFSKQTGQTIFWGKTYDDDPSYNPHGNDILDLEISASSEQDLSTKHSTHIYTHHGCMAGCKFCYKKNMNQGSVHMPLSIFKKIMDKMSPTLCSIAFGVLSPFEQHPQVWEIFEEAHNRGVISCVTLNELVSHKTAIRLAKACGAVAISVNKHNKEKAYESIKRLSIDNNMKQVNIHIVLSNDTVEFIKGVIDDIKIDTRLAKLNALVMLSFKDKAKTNHLTPISSPYYKKVIDYCTNAGINFGFDSCSAKCYLEAIKDNPNRDELTQYVETCESLKRSLYINVFGKAYACSFMEGVDEWKDGIDVVNTDFEELWNGKRAQKWRYKLDQCCTGCPHYEIGV